MSEADVVERLAQQTDTLLAGISLIFSIVSAYVVALNYFIGSANLLARVASFAFMTLIMGNLAASMAGVQSAHAGLQARLVELQQQGQLTAVGRSLLANATPSWTGILTGTHYSIDLIVSLCTGVGLAFVYLGLAYLTFIHKWTQDVIPVSIQK